MADEFFINGMQMAKQWLVCWLNAIRKQNNYEPTYKKLFELTKFFSLYAGL